MVNFQIYKTHIKPPKPTLIKPVKPAGLGFMKKTGFMPTLSATGFLLRFFTQPISSDKRRDFKVSSFLKAMNPGAGSTLITAGGPS